MSQVRCRDPIDDSMTSAIEPQVVGGSYNHVQ